MLKRSFKVIAVILVLCMLLPACGKKKTAITFDENGNYVPTEQIDVNVWYTQGTDYTSGSKIEDDVVYKWLFDRTKVNIKNIYGNDGGQWDTKLSRLIAGNNLPEMIACSSGQGVTHFKKLADVDKIWGITEEQLKKYAPNVWDRMPKELLNKFKFDGEKYYGIPYMMESNTENQPGLSEEELDFINNKIKTVQNNENMALWIRDDILKMIYPNAKTWKELEQAAIAANAPIGDLCFDIPIKTKEEYIDFMYKIKELGLKENGKPVYSYGYSGGDCWEAFVYIGGDMLGYKKSYYTGAWDNVNKKVVLPLTGNMIYETAKEQNKMLNDGVFDPESLVHTNTMFKEKVSNGEYAIACLNYAGGAAQINAQLERQGKKYRYRPFVVDIPVNKEIYPGKTPEGVKYSIAFTKTLDENQLIQMLNWLNVQFSTEFEDVYWWGPKEADLYIENADGTRKYKDENFNDRFINENVSALEDKYTKGICAKEGGMVGAWYCIPVNYKQSRFAPNVLNKSVIVPPYSAVRSFTSDSEHAQLEDFPPFNAWDPAFGDIEEVVEFWAQREQWESGFKIALAANKNEFESKWEDALEALERIVDTEKMTSKMTKISKVQYDELKE